MHVLVIGSGIFGVTAALELRARACDVTLVDPGPIPHPLAESTDISKIVRCDYAADEDYTILGERALEGWRRWNTRWRTPRFHETGVMFLTRTPMPAGGFDLDSFTLLSRRGHHVERLDAAAIAARFPAYRPGAFVDGYFHREGGWAESGATVAQLVEDAALAGVTVRPHTQVTRLVERGVLLRDATAGTHGPDGSHGPRAETHLAADHIIICAGAWTPLLVPELATTSMRATGQPVFHLRPTDPTLFAPDRFPVFGADISRTGYYGFPMTRDGIVKIANHGTGTDLGPDDPRHVSDAQDAAFRAFVADTFPALADAPIVYRRLCVYGDTRDGHFWIARHPQRADVTVAAGGSGHGFKFAPVLGELIADIALGQPNPFAPKFRWRDLSGDIRGDAARSS